MPAGAPLRDKTISFDSDDASATEICKADGHTRENSRKKDDETYPMKNYRLKECLAPNPNTNHAGSKVQRGPRTEASRPWFLLFVILCLAVSAARINAVAQSGTGVLLPNGKEFISWEQPTQFTKTYYVDNRNPNASDSNSGAKEHPFLTINKAAQVLQPGERVIIMTGVYRERVDPARGGTGPDKMISYEAAPGANVVVKGSRVVKTGWEPSTEFRLTVQKSAPTTPRIYKRRLDDLDFQGYNPFGMVNIMQDRVYLKPKPEELRRHLLRRGMVYVDGKRLEQVELF